MTTTKISIRELSRKGKEISKYDFVDIEDKKSKQYRGVFISPQHAEDVKKFLEGKLKKEKNDRLKRVMKFSGMASGKFGDETIQSIKSKKEL